MPISRTYNAIFVHIPKTGGTSIEDMLNIRYSRKDPKSNFFNVFRFTIVRNPWDRFASAYAFVHRHRLPVKRSTPIDQLIFSEDVARRRDSYHEPYHEFFIPHAVRDKKGARHINQRRPEDEVVPTD
jgi:hypothetical protein